MRAWMTRVHRAAGLRHGYHVRDKFCLYLGFISMVAICQNCHRGNDDPSHLFAFEGAEERHNISGAFEREVLR